MSHIRLPRAISVLSTFVLATVLLQAPPASAATFNVGCPGTPGSFPPTTLTDAINATVVGANVNAQSDTIILTAGCHYNLTTTLDILPDVNNSVTIVGNGATISGGGAVRVFNVHPLAKLNLNGVTVAHGSSSTGGGGIFNRGRVHLINSSIVMGHATNGSDGGGIYNRGGSVQLVNSGVRYCDATGRGGGIFNGEGGTLSILDSSTLSHNTATADGAGIFNYYGSVFVRSSRVSDNSSSNGVGAMFNIGGTATFNDSTVSDNQGPRAGFVNYGNLVVEAGSILSENRSVLSGGAIYNGYQLTITDSLVTDNESGQAGGGIFTTRWATLTNSRVSNNRSPQGGGIFVDGNFYNRPLATLNLNKSVVSHNQAGGFPYKGGPFRGGGIHTVNAVVQATNSTRISHNVAYGEGGGIFDGVNDGSFGISTRLKNSTLSDNQAIGANSQGGGISSFAWVEFTASTVSDNEAAFGGGVANWGTFELESGSTVSDNHASRQGGGIFTGVGMTGYDSTISDNTAEESGGGIFNLGNVTVSRFTIADNRSVTRDGGGIFNDGGVYENAGHVTLTRPLILRNRALNKGGGIYSIAGDVDIDGTNQKGTSRLSQNRAGAGGAIFNQGGTLDVKRTEMSSNRAAGGGGGVYNELGIIDMRLSRLSRNRAGGQGGGIFKDGGDLTVEKSTFSDNVAGEGAAISTTGGNSSITASTLSGNDARTFGGGISTSDLQLLILNSTLSGNKADQEGGGLFSASGKVTVSWTTFVGNDTGDDTFSSFEGGSIYRDSGSTVKVDNSIVLSSRGGNSTSPTHSNCYGPISGFNSWSDTACASGFTVGPIDLVRSLAVNSNITQPYPTWTHALLPGSVALNKGTSGCPQKDQQNVSRPQTTPCDIGAFELP